MKHWFPFCLLLLATPALAGNWFGSGPWANATYYPGNLDGKYQASVTGVNTAGVLGFAIRDGAPPFLQLENQSLSDNALIADTVAVNQQIELDRSLNYYAIFVNGRAYAGTTAAGINYNASTVTGTLLGSTPISLTNTNNVVSSQVITNIGSTNLVTTNITITNLGSVLVTNISVVTNRTVLSNVETVLLTNQVADPVLIATGVDGFFQANITGKRGVFSFQGPGQLSSPGPVISNQQVNPVTAFNVNGIRVSFSSQATFQSLTPPTAAQ